MIRDYGGVAGVLLVNGRNIVTIILSFVLFAKQFITVNTRQKEKGKEKEKKATNQSNSHDHNV